MDRFLLFVALGGLMASGQAAAPVGVLAGKVVDATSKEGIRKATVYATAEQSSGSQPSGVHFTANTIYSAVTDESGTFRFTAIPPGAYSLRAEKAAYLVGRGTALTRAKVVAGEEITVPAIPLARHGIISGRVTDSDGDPLEQVSVQAIPVRGGRGAGSQMRNVMTDDRGEFRIAQLAAGSYKLLANKPSSTQVVGGRGEASQVSAPTYFPAATDYSAAASIQVGSGEERSGVEIRLQTTAAVRVAGRVSSEVAGNLQMFLQLNPLPGARGTGMAFNHWSAVADAEGRFAFQNVQAGEYLMIGNAHKAGSPQPMTGFTRVRVGSQPVDDVSLTLRPPARITGRALAEGNAKLPEGRVQFAFRPVEPGTPGGGGGVVKSDGSFLVENSPRARLRAVPIAPRGWYLKTLSVGGQPQSSFEFDVAGGEASVELVYSNKPGTVQVSLASAADSGPALIAVAIPEGGEPQQIQMGMYRSAPIPAGANAGKIEDVPPGNYLILVCVPTVLDALNDPAVWEKVKGSGATAKVEEGGTVSVSPRLITENELEEK